MAITYESESLFNIRGLSMFQKTNTVFQKQKKTKQTD